MPSLETQRKRDAPDDQAFSTSLEGDAPAKNPRAHLQCTIEHAVCTKKTLCSAHNTLGICKSERTSSTCVSYVQLVSLASTGPTHVSVGRTVHWGRVIILQAWFVLELLAPLGHCEDIESIIRSSVSLSKCHLRDRAYFSCRAFFLLTCRCVPPIALSPFPRAVTAEFCEQCQRHHGGQLIGGDPQRKCGNVRGMDGCSASSVCLCCGPSSG